MLPSSSLTDPDVQISRFRFFMEEPRSRWCDHTIRDSPIKKVSKVAVTLVSVLAGSAIRCRFVDRFVRLKVLSRVSRQRFSPHGTPLPSVGSR